jgi:hypothetical protein
LSVATTTKTLRFNEDVKTKLGYEWKNVYRALASADIYRKGSVPLGTFNKIISQHRVYLQKEEIKKLEQLYCVNGENPLITEIDYIKLSQELGLHKQSMDFIKPNSIKYAD